MRTRATLQRSGLRKNVWVIAGAIGWAACGGGGVGGCGPKDELAAPEVLLSPYGVPSGPEAPSGADVLWAVAPMRNESGTTGVDPWAVADALVQAAEEVRGVSAVPMNRTVAAMRALEIDVLASPGEVEMLRRALGVDGIIVGSITTWDPYDPPKLGLSLALYAPGAGQVDRIDPRELVGAATEQNERGENGGWMTRPASVSSEVYDAASHEVLMGVRRYAEGRHDRESALHWKRYTASMELYTQFGAYTSVSRLLEAERLRLARESVASASVQE